FDSWAGIIPDAEFRRYVIEPTARIAGGVRQRHDAARLLGSPRGARPPREEHARSTGATALGGGDTVPLRAARPSGTQRPVQGNLDPVLLLTGGEPMSARIREIRAAFVGKPHIFNLGHGVLPETPPEHVVALVAAVRAAR